eukprot:3670088-Amphidinium_carterae.1
MSRHHQCACWLVGSTEFLCACVPPQASPSILGKIYAVLEFFVDFVLRLTLFWCDVKDIKKEKFWVQLSLQRTCRDTEKMVRDQDRSLACGGVGCWVDRCLASLRPCCGWHSSHTQWCS